MNTRWILFLMVTIGAACSRRNAPYILSGQVKDPFTGKGIPRLYISFQGVHATGFMGGTEYFEDLVLDSTDQNGSFHLRVPPAVIDSFIDKEGGPLSVYRFALDLRPGRSKEWSDPYSRYNIFSEFLPVDTILFNDRNYLNHRTYILTEKNQRIHKDTTGMSIPFYRGGALCVSVPAKDTDYIRKALLAVRIQQQSAADGKVLKEGERFYDDQALQKALLVRPRTPLNIIFRKYYRATQKGDTLLVLRNIRLEPGEERAVSLK